MEDSRSACASAPAPLRSWLSVGKKDSAFSDRHYPKILERSLMLGFADGGDMQVPSSLGT